MTVMPNFRLSETDARDIATYLFSLSSPLMPFKPTMLPLWATWALGLS